MGDMGNRVRSVVYRLTALALVAAVTIGCSVPTLSARRGGVFVVALDSPVLTLDPALVTELSSARVVKQMCETLVSYDAETGTFQPRLAVSWAVSGDGRVWTFTLRSGVIFHDGTPLTSDAVVQNITRWFDPASPFHRGDFDYWQMIFGGFRGSGSIVRSVERVDDYRVRLTLEQPLFDPDIAYGRRRAEKGAEAASAIARCWRLSRSFRSRLSVPRRWQAMWTLCVGARYAPGRSALESGPATEQLL